MRQYDGAIVLTLTNTITSLLSVRETVSNKAKNKSASILW